MKLYSSPASPFARKVLVAAHECGAIEQIEIIPTNPHESTPEFVAINPLSKIPALITEDGEVIFDSPVIGEYLDSLQSGVELVPKDGAQRLAMLGMQALGDGLMDAAVLRQTERRRANEPDRLGVMERQRAVIARGIGILESRAGQLGDGTIDLGKISVGCLLGYLDFRFAEDNWRDNHPALAAWYTDFSARPSMQATTPD